MQSLYSISAARRMVCLVASSLVVLFLPTVAAATIMVVAGPPYSLGATSDDQTVSGTDSDSVNVGALLPYVDTLTANDGDASSTVNITMNQSVFDFGVTLQSAGNPLGGDGGNGFSAWILFSVDTATAYSIEAALGSAETVGNGSGQIFVWLRDTGTVFQSDQQESIAEGEGFAIDVDGAPGGDNVNNVVGAQSGVLLPGVNYTLNVTLANSMAQTPLSGMGASGSFSMSFSTVPEPSTASLLALGLVGIAALRRR